MENASKMLIMAGEILIAILIISAMVYLFTGASSLQNIYDQKLTEDQIQTFNANFIKYEGKEEITAHEIVSLINFANEYNKKVENDIKYKITVAVGGKEITDCTKFINENMYNEDNKTLKKFKTAKIEYNEVTHLIKKINFTELM